MEHVDKNRAGWNRESDEYQAQHGRRLEDTGCAWGVWRIPESEVDALEDISGKDVLEMGCGAAQWSIALARLGARVVGLDLSDQQLVHARQCASRSGLSVPLVQANGESLPFGASRFDVVFCDHGAMTFARPDRTVAEAARVLRTGGLLAFCMAAPFHDLCWDESADAVTDRLQIDYFELFAIEDEGTVCFQLGYGDWIRLFRRHGLVVEDLIELRAPENATTTYTDFVTREWARRWPAEHIWKVRKMDSVAEIR